MRSEAIVTMPPLVVRTRASSTVFVKASSLVNLDFGGIMESAIENIWSLKRRRGQLLEPQRFQLIVDISAAST